VPVIDTKRHVMELGLAPAPYNDRFARVLGSALTPAQVTSILSMADLGYLWQIADLLDECRERDGHLHSQLQSRELRVAGAEWELRPPVGSGARGAEIARWCTARLLEIEADDALQRSFPDALVSLMTAVYQARAGLEVTWRSEGRRMVPASLHFIHPRRFAFTTDWRLHLWDASGTATTYASPENTNANGPFGQFPGLPLAAFPAGKFVVHQPVVRGVYPTREGLGRLLVWWSTFKRFDIRDLLAYAQWAGRGLRVGTYSTGKGKMGEYVSTPDDQQVLLEALDAMSSTVSVAIADTTKLDVISAPTNNDVHDRLASLCNAEMSKAIVGGTLGSEVTAGGGNRALGEVHERGELVIARSDAQQLAATLRRDLLRPMVEMSFGVGRLAPSIVFATDPAGDLDGLAKRMKIFADMGGRLGQRSSANALQLPEIEDDEETFGGKAQTPSTPAEADGVSDTAQTPQRPTEDS
jgi:phage gp29-like protein